MTFEEVINMIVKELSIPEAQGWVTLTQLVEKAKELDDDKKRRNH